MALLKGFTESSPAARFDDPGNLRKALLKGEMVKDGIAKHVMKRLVRKRDVAAFCNRISNIAEPVFFHVLL